MNLTKEIKEGGGSKRVPLVVVAIDKDKNSQNALKWALNNLVTSKGETITLVHVNTHKAGSPPSEDGSSIRDIFDPFRIICKRKDVNCIDIILHDTDIAKAIVDFIIQASIGEIVLGESSRFFRRLKGADVPAKVKRDAPYCCCTTYVVSSKGRLSTIRMAWREAPYNSYLRTHIEKQTRMKQETEEYQTVMNSLRGEYAQETRFELSFSPLMWLNFELPISQSLMGEDSETEMGRHRLEVKQMIEMYNTACKETLDAKKQIVEFRQQIKEEERRLWKAKQAQEAAIEMVEKECAKCRVAVVAAYKNIIKGEDKEMIIAESKTTEVVIPKDMVITDRSIDEDTYAAMQFYHLV